MARRPSPECHNSRAVILALRTASPDTAVRVQIVTEARDGSVTPLLEFRSASASRVEGARTSAESASCDPSIICVHEPIEFGDQGSLTWLPGSHLRTGSQHAAVASSTGWLIRSKDSTTFDVSAPGPKKNAGLHRNRQDRPKPPGVVPLWDRLPFMADRCGCPIEADTVHSAASLLINFSGIIGRCETPYFTPNPPLWSSAIDCDSGTALSRASQDRHHQGAEVFAGTDTGSLRDRAK
jgi:hypothetical protein